MGTAATAAGGWRACRTVLRKEFVDALRDRGTLLTVLISAVAMGPLVLLLLSSLISDLEARAMVRRVVVVGIEEAPALRNFFERQAYSVDAPPADFENRLREGSLREPVLRIHPGFAAAVARGEAPVVELLSSSANASTRADANRLARLLDGYEREQRLLRLAMRGIAPGGLAALDVQERDLAPPAARAAQFTLIVPFFVMMAVLYGALNAALDTTAGERERGSLEPLLVTPAPTWALAVGKWSAVVIVAMGVAILSCLSFLPGQWLIRSESLAALFRFGAREAVIFIAVLFPLAAAASALLMAVAIRCTSVKQAQAQATIVMLALSLLPMAGVFNPRPDAEWIPWVPALAQVTAMGQVLKGEASQASDLMLPAVVCAGTAALCLVLLVRGLKRAAGH